MKEKKLHRYPTALFILKKALQDARFLKQFFLEFTRKIEVWNPSFRKLEDEIGIKWLGHATFLLYIGKYKILTDPVFVKRIGFGLGAVRIGPKRFWTSRIEPCELSHIDLVLISHSHMDHLDIRSLKKFSSIGCLIAPPIYRTILRG